MASSRFFSTPKLLPSGVCERGVLRRAFSICEFRGHDRQAFSEVIRTQPELLEEHFGRSSTGSEPVVALNTAHFQDGAFVKIETKRFASGFADSVCRHRVGAGRAARVNATRTYCGRREREATSRKVMFRRITMFTSATPSPKLC